MGEAYRDTPDTLTAALSLEGRNLLARAKVGDIVYQQLGWQLGRGGYIYTNPVKTTSIVDLAVEAEGAIEVIDNGAAIEDWDIGNYISLNGKRFIFGTHFTRGTTPELTIRNIRGAILDSKDSRHYRLVEPIEDGSRLKIRSLVTGAIGNSYPISVYNISHNNLAATPMAGGISSTLEEAAWPTPSSILEENPIFLPYSGTDGLIEMPASTSLSFMSRAGEGEANTGAYGELGLWVEIKKSTFPLEIGRRVLYAVAHFPIQPKTDRTILTFRVVISF